MILRNNMNNIKTITTIDCPNCHKPVFIEFTNQSPELTAAFTVEDMMKAKEDAKLRIEYLEIDHDKKEQVLKWIGDESTIFGPGEVDEIVMSLTTIEK